MVGRWSHFITAVGFAVVGFCHVRCLEGYAESHLIFFKREQEKQRKYLITIPALDR